MKKFKTADTWLSTASITGFLTYAIICPDSMFIVGYFIVGGWQLISMAVHAAKGWCTPKGSKRNIYHKIVCSLVFLALIGMAIPPLLYALLYGLLFAAPFMAIYYTLICYREVYVKMKRPLAQLR